MNQNINLKQKKHQNIKQILETAVESVRMFLKCDRVVVYNVKDIPRVGVIAESNNKKCSSLVGKIVKDPFLEDSFDEFYHEGMCLTVDDVYTSFVSNNDGLEDLEKLEIKSVAVAPIYIDRKKLAFIAAHQCAESKPWRLETANFLAQKASETGLTISAVIKAQKVEGQKSASSDRTRRETVDSTESKVNYKEDNNFTHKDGQTLIQQTKSRLFAEIKDKITQNPEQPEALQTVVADLRLLLECDRILVYRLDDLNRTAILIESSAAKGKEVSDDITKDFDFADECLGKDCQDKIYCWSHRDDKNVPTWYRAQINALEVKAGLIAPILNEGQPLGLLIAHQCSDTRSWQEQEIEWIGTIANYIDNMLEQIGNSNGTKQEKQQLADVQQQLEKQRMWTKYFADAVQQIRKSLNTKDILKTSVAEVHRILDCDRVLIYTLNHDSYGKIVAESVSPGWTKAEGRLIKDPCFEARYLEKYRDGRFRAWNDIYKAEMTPCHIEQLELLEVKANLVVPIINERKLFGLLVAQQCSSTRQWQQAEILWLIQIATQIGFAIGNSQLIADAQRLRQQAEKEKVWTGYFTDAVQQIRQSLREKDVLQASVREVRRVLNCDRVLIYTLDRKNYGLIAAESVAHGWTRGEGRVIKDPCFEARYLEKYRDGRVRVWNDIYQAGMTNCHLEQLEMLEVKANLVVPIVSGGKLFGLLVAQQCSGTREWSQPEIDWSTQIAQQIGLALGNARLLERLDLCTQNTQQILSRATKSSVSIQRTVNSVTTGLENLSNSCEGFSQTLQNIKDLGKQLAQQSMNMTRIVNLNQVDPSNQNSVAELSDQVFSLMQELFEATAKIDPLFASIKTEITTKAGSLETETQELMSEVDDFQTASQNLEEILTLNHEMSNLIKEISDSLETQIKGSTFTKNSVHELANITERISQQSIAIIQSFNQFALSGN